MRISLIRRKQNQTNKKTIEIIWKDFCIKKSLYYGSMYYKATKFAYKSLHDEFHVHANRECLATYQSLNYVKLFCYDLYCELLRKYQKILKLTC